VNKKPKKLKKCRISGSHNLTPVLDLGVQYLTGVFPSDPNEEITKGPLSLVWCPDSYMLQLDHSYDASEMYGDNYGYRSGLNCSMVNHLENKIKHLERMYEPKDSSIVLDIGSNDATSLKSYNNKKIKRIGIDPVGEKFRSFYDDGINLIPEFYSSDCFLNFTKGKTAKIITSISMFYDLEDPINFAANIRSALDLNGVWHFEQSYMPSMLRTCSYDTICHEHLEYYSLTNVEKILRDTGFRILDIEMNAVNGGSFAVTACRDDSSLTNNSSLTNWLLEQEDKMGLTTPRPFRDFEERVFRHRDDLKRLIGGLKSDGKKILGYGASTKGNVLLQFCDFNQNDIGAIAEVNKDKFGCITPGTNIPIISESEARKQSPDYFLVLPWHFKSSILEREKIFRMNGGKFIFPFPEIEIV
jgi:hypothetical protein